MGINIATQSTQPVTVIESAMKELFESYEKQCTAVSDLERRLAPVLTPVIACDVTEQASSPKPIESPVITDIRRYADNFRWLTSRIHAVLNNLEV
jgi:hypothetical protein